MPPMPGSTLIVGCGYLGGRVADALTLGGRPVFALTRARADELTARGIRPILGDVTDPGSLQQLPEVERVVYAVGMDRSAGKSMREVYVGGLRNVLAALPGSPRFTYVSSTGVYGQTSGEWVTEESATDPTEESGKVVLEAEQALREVRPDATILRFAGIYGPGRLLRKQPLLKGDPYVGDADKFLNLIHVADGVRAVLAAESYRMARVRDGRQGDVFPPLPAGERSATQLPGEGSSLLENQNKSPHPVASQPTSPQRGEVFPPPPGRTFNIADGTPVSRRDFYTHLAQLLAAPPARFEPSPTPAVEPNRRVATGAARVALDFAPEFPTFAEGLAASLES